MAARRPPPRKSLTSEIDTIKKISVKQISTADAFDRLGNPIEGGPFDPVFGPFNMREICPTCNLNSDDCPGHFGLKDIELAVPVFHPITFTKLLRLFKSHCWGCHHFMYTRKQMQYWVKLFKFLDAGEMERAKEMRIKLNRDYTSQAILDLKKELEKKKKSEDGSDEEEEEEEDAEVLSDAEKEDSDADDEVLNAGYSPAGGKFTHIEMKRASWTRKFFTALKKCSNCGLPARKIRHENGTSKVFLMALSQKEKVKLQKSGIKFPGVMGAADLDDNMSVSDETVRLSSKKKVAPGRVVTQLECRAHFDLLFENERPIIDVLFGEKVKGDDNKYHRRAHINAFFVDCMAVIPPRFRPAQMLDGRMTFHAQNKSLDAIMLANSRILAMSKDKERKERAASSHRDPYLDLWSALQRAVNQSFDASSGATLADNAIAPGVKQILEKKQGLFRMNMMGKRVNYAARTVISPDCFLQTDEIGVPQYFAETLTFKQPVTAFNYKEMAQLVINGPKYPGALVVEDEFGQKTVLSALDEQKRIGVSKTLLTPSNNAPPGSVKRVWRNLQDGDYVLMNRQPTLHKPSIMAHRAKIIRSSDRVLRMHYANCATYNADFDGDEMNLHFPQSFVGQAEAKHIAATDHQYIVPRNGMPLRGLIQDSVISGALLTKRDAFFNRSQFQELLYSSLFNVNPKVSIQIPPPAIIKPVPLWTGKQVITATLNQITAGSAPITLECGTKIPVKLWGTKLGDLMNEGIVYVKNNELLCGVLDKNQFGASAFGLVHCAYELYGAQTATVLLSTLSRLFVNYLQSHAFTCGIDDLLLKDDAAASRKSLLESSNEIGRSAAAQFLGHSKYDKKAADAEMNGKLKTEREIARLDTIMKGKLHPVTSSVISACIPNGQMKLFPDNNFSMMTVSGAKGSQVNFSQVSCLLGQQELEGKRVPRMASGKTLPCFEPYDPTARAGGFIMDRFLTGIRPQEYFFHCMAGREGLIDTAVKTARSGYLQRCLIKNLENLVVHYDGTVRDNSDNSVVQFYYGEDGLDVVKTGFINNPKFGFFARNFQILAERVDLDSVEKMFQESEAESHGIWAKYDAAVKKEKGSKPTVEPPMTNYSPGTHLGAVSAKFHTALEEYIKKNPDNVLDLEDSPLTGDVFRQLMWLKYQACLVNPGEAVGLLAAQSVGEPSTQMTLNTFHLAGRGEANVTLGVPRLREIIMTASKIISTPMMEVVMNDPTDKAAAEEFANSLQPIKLSEIVESITTEEAIDKDNLSQRKYVISLNFIENYKKILEERHYPQKKFSQVVPAVAAKVATAVKIQLNRAVYIQQQQKGRKGKSGDDDDDETPSIDDRRNKDDDEDDEAVGDEDGATAEKERKKKEEQMYDEDEDDEAAKKIQDDKEKEDDSDDEDEDEEDEDEDADSKKKKKKAKKDKKKKSEDDEEEEEEEDEESSKKSRADEDKLSKYEIKFAKNNTSLSFSIRIPLESRKLLMVSIVEKVLEKFYVKSIGGITRVLVVESDKKGPKGEKLYSVQTEGVNFGSIWRSAEELKSDSIYSNHIYGVLKTYGVEAARALIMKEMYSVFKVYDITVDWRHLGLIADFMTFAGGFRGMNRSTMAMSASPFQKMSYESATRFLSEAATNSDIDPLQSTSSRIVMGELVRSGTGLFSVGVRVTPVVTEQF